MQEIRKGRTTRAARSKQGRLNLLLPFSFLLLLSTSVLPTISFLQAHRASDSGLLEMGRAANLSHAAKSPSEIKIVSYNIRWRGGDDLRKLIQLFKHDPEIGEAAIIGLQEVDRNKKRTSHINTIKLIAEDLGKHYAWAAPPTAKPHQEEESGVAILSDYPLADVQRIVLPHAGPGQRRRVAIGATVSIAEAPLRVYSVHSENRMSLGKKLEQMQAVLKDLAKHPKDLRTVILGDLNTWEPDAVDLTSELFVKESFTTPFPNGQSTFLRRIIIPIKFKLDWIWLRGLEPTRHGIDKKIGLSDHFPLWTVVRLNRRT